MTRLALLLVAGASPRSVYAPTLAQQVDAVVATFLTINLLTLQVGVSFEETAP